MCNHHSLAYFLDEIRKESLWQDGTEITGLNFKMHTEAVILIAKRRKRNGEEEVCFITRRNARECLRALWHETVRVNSGVNWRHDKFTG